LRRAGQEQQSKREGVRESFKDGENAKKKTQPGTTQFNLKTGEKISLKWQHETFIPGEKDLVGERVKKAKKSGKEQRSWWHVRGKERFTEMGANIRAKKGGPYVEKKSRQERKKT